MSRRKNKLVPFETIVLATQGDPQALEQVIRHYRPYILSLCRREYIAENGNVFRLPILPEGGQSTPPAGLWKN